MSKIDTTRKAINILAQKYVQQSKGKVSHYDARKRVIKAITKGE